MEVSIYLPDDIIQQGQAEWEDVPRHVLESLALAWYQSGELSEEQARRLLGYETRLEVHAFLKDHDVPLRYTLEDLEKDREAHRELGPLNAGRRGYLSSALPRIDSAGGYSPRSI